jgi:hypothetical protein
MCAALFSYVWRRGEQCRGADGRHGESCSSRGVVAHLVLVQEQLSCPAAARGPVRGCHQRGSVRGTSVVVATSCPRALQQHRGCRHSARRGVAVAVVTTSCPRALQQHRGCRQSARRGAVVAGVAAQG